MDPNGKPNYKHSEGKYYLEGNEFQVGELTAWIVYLGNPSLVYPGNHPDQGGHHLLFHAHLPRPQISTAMSGDYRPLLLVHDLDFDH